MNDCGVPSNEPKVPSSAPATAPNPKPPMCSGHWIGSLSASCGDLGELAEFDLVLRAQGPAWHVSLTKPKGAIVKSVDVRWSAIAWGCHTAILIEKDARLLGLNLSNGARPLVEHTKYSFGAGPAQQQPPDLYATADLECEIKSQFTFTPDDGAVPSPDPELARAAGDYTLNLAWEQNDCRFDELPVLRFRLAVDPRESNNLRTGDKFDLLAMLFRPGLTHSEIVETTQQGIRITQTYSAVSARSSLERRATLDIAPHGARLLVVHSLHSEGRRPVECTSMATMRR